MSLFPSRPLRFTSHLHPGRVSPHCRSWYLCLTSTHVTSQLNPVPKNCISAPPRHYLKAIQHYIHDFHIHPCPVSIASRSQDSLPPILHLAYTQVLIFVSHLHQVSYYLQPAINMCGPPPSRSHLTPYRSRYEYRIPLHPVSPPLRPQYSHLTSI